MVLNFIYNVLYVRVIRNAVYMVVAKGVNLHYVTKGRNGMAGAPNMAKSDFVKLWTANALTGAAGYVNSTGRISCA